MRVHPLWVVTGVALLVGGAVAWNEMRRGYDDARAATPPATAAAAPGDPVPAEPAAPAPVNAQPPAEPSEPPAIADARKLVLARLKDPDSAQFRGERVLSNGSTVCLEVNAKNGYGGYNGFTQAVVIAGASGEPVAWVDGVEKGIAAAACDAS